MLLIIITSFLLDGVLESNKKSCRHWNRRIACSHTGFGVFVHNLHLLVRRRRKCSAGIRIVYAGHGCCPPGRGELRIRNESDAAAAAAAAAAATHWPMQSHPRR